MSDKKGRGGKWFKIEANEERKAPSSFPIDDLLKGGRGKKAQGKGRPAVEEGGGERKRCKKVTLLKKNHRVPRKKKKERRNSSALTGTAADRTEPGTCAKRKRKTRDSS